MEQKLLKLEPRLLSDFFFVLLFSGQLKLHQAWWAPGIHKEAGRLHPAERGEDSIHPVKALSELAGSGCWNSSRSTAASQSSVQCGQWLVGLFSGLRWLHQCHVKDTGQEKAEQLELKHLSPWPLKLISAQMGLFSSRFKQGTVLVTFLFLWRGTQWSDVGDYVGISSSTLIFSI